MINFAANSRTRGVLTATSGWITVLVYLGGVTGFLQQCGGGGATQARANDRDGRLGVAHNQVLLMIR